METLTTNKQYFDCCGKNLRVIRQSNVVRIGNQVFCSVSCSQMASQKKKTIKLSRLFGGAEVVVTQER